MKRKAFTLPRETQLTGNIIKKLIEKHKNYIADYERLESYFDNDPKIDRKKPNDIVVYHNFAKYITTLNVGHLLGNPVQYQASKGVDISPILDAYKSQTISDLDSEIGEDCSMFGRGYELVYLDDDGNISSAKLDVYNTVIVYDNTFQHNKLFAIAYTPVLNSSGNPITDNYDLTFWDEKYVTTAKFSGADFTITEKPVQHNMGSVPVIEYVNNRRFTGDYESVITGIDAYNILQSDRVIDREKLIDAILVFYGVNLEPEDKAKLKSERTVGLPQDAKAEYVIKNINEADAEVLRKTIAADIHKFSMTPDLSDENFAGNSSGVALLYKLLAFEQNVKKKERYFEKGLMERFKLYSHVLHLKSELSSEISTKDVDAIFNRNLPKNDYEASQMINNLRGIVDSALLVSQLSFVRDGEETVKLAKEEGKPEFNDNYATRLPNVYKNSANNDED
jgi:SPP1 family phage portal protein